MLQFIWNSGSFHNENFWTQRRTDEYQTKQFWIPYLHIFPMAAAIPKVHKKSLCVVKIFLKSREKCVQVACQFFVTIVWFLFLLVSDFGLNFYPVMLRIETEPTRLARIAEPFSAHHYSVLFARWASGLITASSRKALAVCVVILAKLFFLRCGSISYGWPLGWRFAIYCQLLW